MSDEGAEVNSFKLSGPVTVYESSEKREALLAELSKGRALRIDLETSGPWDLAGLQLLISCTVSRRELGRPVRFFHVPRVCAEKAESAGLAGWLRDSSDSFL